MFDRYWRLRVVGALASGATAVAIAVWYVAYVLPIDLRAGTLAFTGIVAAIDVVFVLLGIAAYQVLKAAPQRRRAALRQEAMAGNQDAMPLARPLPGAAANTQIAYESFEVGITSAFKQWLSVIAILAILVVVTWGFIAAASEFMNVHRLSAALQCAQGQEANCAGTLAASMLLNLMFLVGYILICVYAITDALRPLVFSSVRLRVQAEGIVRQTLTGRSLLIPWPEIRLVEVWHSSARQGAGWVRSRHYRCFTRAYQFGWVYLEGAAASNPVARLIAAVSANTGLRARTFDNVLFAHDAVPHFNWNERAHGLFGGLLVSVALVIAMVAFLPALSPRDRSGDQTALIIITIGLMFYLLMWFRPPRISAREQGGTALVSAASFDDAQLVIHPAVTYEMTVGSYPLFVANQVVFVILGLIMTAFGAAFFLQRVRPLVYDQSWQRDWRWSSRRCGRTIRLCWPSWAACASDGCLAMSLFRGSVWSGHAIGAIQDIGSCPAHRRW